jgi:hypothetical protein
MVERIIKAGGLIIAPDQTGEFTNIMEQLNPIQRNRFLPKRGKVTLTHVAEWIAGEGGALGDATDS